MRPGFIDLLDCRCVALFNAFFFMVQMPYILLFKKRMVATFMHLSCIYSFYVYKIKKEHCLIFFM